MYLNQNRHPLALALMADGLQVVLQQSSSTGLLLLNKLLLRTKEDSTDSAQASRTQDTGISITSLGWGAGRSCRAGGGSRQLVYAVQLQPLLHIIILLGLKKIIVLFHLKNILNGSQRIPLVHAEEKDISQQI